MAKIEIDKDTVLQPGEIIEMHFKRPPLGDTILTTAYFAAIEKKIYGKGFKFKGLTRTDTHFIYLFEVEKPKDQEVAKAGLTAGFVAAAVIGGGLFMWLSLDKIYKITDSPGAKLSVGFIAAAIFLFAFRAIK